MPIVVLAINVCDGRGSKLFGGNVFQASQIYSINSDLHRARYQMPKERTPQRLQK